MIIPEQTMRLLRDCTSDPTAIDLHRELLRSEIIFECRRIDLLTEIIGAYHVRARTNEERSEGFIRGFDILMPNLDALVDERFVLIRIIADNVMANVFLNENMNHLLGVLLFPEDERVRGLTYDDRYYDEQYPELRAKFGPVTDP